MIRSFRDHRTAALFNDQDVPRFRASERGTRCKLLFLHQVQTLDELRTPSQQSARSPEGQSQRPAQYPH